MYEHGEYLTWTRSGEIQLPDFQRGYKWEDERIRQLLVTVLRGHPLGAVMLLKTGNTQVRFKPRAISARTNRTIGGVAPSSYLKVIESRARLESSRVDALLALHLVSANLLRTDDFDAFFKARRESLCKLIEAAIVKNVQRDIDHGFAEEDSAHIELDELEDDTVTEND